MDLHDTIALVIGMLIVAMAVALAVRRWRLPYTIVLVIVGLIIALTERWPGLRLSGDQYSAVCYNLLLPALLFEAALNLKWEAFVRNWKTIFTLALPGTLVSIGLVGSLVHYLLGVPLLQSLLLGAIISPTDPLSVLAMFRQLGVSRRLSVLVEGESLFNDAIGLVVFGILLEASQPGAQIVVMDGLISFVVVSLGGAVVGLVLGLGASQITRHVDDHLIEVTLSTVLAYGSFLAAEQMSLGGHHFSGIIAVVVAGLCMGNYGKATGMSATTVVALHTFWEYAAFVVNSIIFLLIGAELGLISELPNPTAVVGYVVLVFLVLQAARAVVTYGASELASKRWEHIPGTWRHLLFWGGLKGALSMIMVLQVDKLTREWGGFDLLLTATFGIVFLSLMIQGLSVRKVTEKLGLTGRDVAVEKYDALVARMIVERTALAQLRKLLQDHVITPKVAESLSAPRRHRLTELEDDIARLEAEADHLERLQTREARRLVHHAEKGALLDAFNRGLISEEALGASMERIDRAHRELEAEAELEKAEIESPEPVTEGSDE